MKLSIVLSAQPAQFNAVAYKGDLERDMARVAEMGYEGVELAIRDPRLVDLNRIVALLDRYGLEVPAIGTGQAWGEEGLSFTDPDPAIRHAAIERVISHIPFARQVGAVIIIGLLRGFVRQDAGVTPEQAMNWLVSALQECAGTAASVGVRLCLEPINRYETGLINTVAEGLALVQQVGADNFGLLLDTFHMNIEEPSLENSILAAGRRIFHFHVADSNRWAPGAGHIDFRRVIHALRQVGYDGWLSLEAMPNPDADTCARQAITHLRSLLSLPR